MKTVKTFYAKIFLGLKERYDGSCHYFDEVCKFVSEYVNTYPTCVTIQPTKFIYYGGGEDGVEIGFINYPRFPKTDLEIRDKAIFLAKALQKEYNQYRVSIMFPDEIVMLEQEIDQNE